MIIIPNLTKLESNEKRFDKDMYETCDVLGFFLEKNNTLYYFLNNLGDKKAFRCLKKYGDNYKVFGYKTSGRLSHTKYFLLDIKKREVFYLSEGMYTNVENLYNWVEYVLNGGSEETAIESNKLEYDPTVGI